MNSQPDATIVNVLADRYASAAMKAVWSPTGRIVLEREFWIAVLKAQRDLGLPVPPDAIAAYERVKDTVNLKSIARREEVTRHDVKARIEEFCSLAGHEHVHKGMTSRDLTENVEQLQVWRALALVRAKAVACLHRLAMRASEGRDVVLAARTHNVAAQPTTAGKRWAMFGEEFLHGLERLDAHIAGYAARGLKGAVGTQLDQMTLLGQDAARVAELDTRVLRHLGIPRALNAVGQVYARSQDFDTLSALVSLASGPSSFAKTLRLMAGHELASEGFLPGQVGSSAMPHKMNSRSCERLNGFHVILRGYLCMAADLAGDQWNEGDVSCSVVRRVMLPDAFYAVDGLLETFLTILNQMELNTAVVAREARHYLPFLLTTTFLMEAVKNGVGRETAHEIIKGHAVASARDLRTGKIGRNDLVERLAQDPRLGLSHEKLDALVNAAGEQTGTAGAQVDAFVAQSAQWAQRFPEALDITPGRML
ncbi:MAG: adenylosuccinate lyase [Puniceicoccales bacterium]|jgi:adenylosuccinate lyase|nr:adenylosuccinate lyase [Puniceicoccales bacterium]